MVGIQQTQNPRSILAHLIISRARRDNRSLTTSEQEAVKNFESVAAAAARDAKPCASLLAFVRRGAR